jgi:hypothetical protein
MKEESAIQLRYVVDKVILYLILLSFFFLQEDSSVKIDESNESWVEVCRRSSKIKSSLRKAKYESDGG